MYAIRSYYVSEWEPLEAEYLHRLQSREPLLRILDAEPFPQLRGSSWEKQAEEFIGARDGTQFRNNFV